MNHPLRTVLTAAALSACWFVADASAALVLSLTNGNFEDRSNNPQTVVIQAPPPVGWSAGTQTSPAGLAPLTWNLNVSTPSVFPTIGGQGALALLATKTGGASWAYQSLGTVGSDDIGDIIDLYVGIGARGTNGVWTGSAFAGIYTGTTSSSLGTLLGTEGSRTITNTIANAKQLQTVHATYTIAPGDLGSQLFAVFRVTPITGGVDVTGQTQWVLDHALFHIPEPTAAMLIGTAALALIGQRNRERK